MQGPASRMQSQSSNAHLSSPTFMQPAQTPVSLRLEDVVVTSEVYARPMQSTAPEVELAAMAQMVQFLTHEPSMMLHQLVETILKVTRAESAGVAVEDVDRPLGEAVWVSLAGTLASRMGHWLPMESPVRTAMDKLEPEVFLRPERFFQDLNDPGLPFEEYMVVPWRLNSTRRGALVLMTHTSGRGFTGEDLRIAISMVNWAMVAMERWDLQQMVADEAAAAVSSSRLADHLAHVLNNPLQALTNLLHLMPYSPIGGEYLLEARHQAERLRDVVQSVVELRRHNRPILLSSLQKIRAEGASASCRKSTRESATSMEAVRSSRPVPWPGMHCGTAERSAGMHAG